MLVNSHASTLHGSIDPDNNHGKEDKGLQMQTIDEITRLNKISNNTESSNNTGSNNGKEIDTTPDSNKRNSKSGSSNGSIARERNEERAD